MIETTYAKVLAGKRREFIERVRSLTEAIGTTTLVR
jgi:hypothetical protein